MDDLFIFDFGQEEYLTSKINKLIKKKRGEFFYSDDKDKKKYRETEAWGMFIRKESVKYQKAFREASSKALKEYYSPHVLRKSRATMMLRAGVPILGVMNILGHKNLKTTQKYLSFEIDELSSDMGRLGL